MSILRNENNETELDFEKQKKRQKWEMYLLMSVNQLKEEAILLF